MNLSPHFTLAEFVASETANARGISNSPNDAQIAAMKALCVNVLEPVRKHFGKPVRITSGFRIWTPTSQHGKGEAADFEVTGVHNIDVARWIRDNLRFDQLILEAWNRHDPNAGWIHCSYRVDRARKSVLRTPTGGPPYFAGLPA
jgi:zinc D-Ala-D-Ala carboxypeptidase